MIKILIKAKNYKQFVNDMLDHPMFGRGAKTRLATHLKVQGSFISLVLSGAQDFSAEHAIKIAEFLKLTADETDYFVTLLHRDRAGTSSLKAYYQSKLDQLMATQKGVSAGIQPQNTELNEQDLSLYYGAWYHAAIHMAIHQPKTRTIAALMDWTELSEAQVRASIDILVKLGFAEFERDKIIPKERRFHLGKKSLSLRAHHMNWRHQAIRSLDDIQPEALHYSLVTNIDPESMKKIRELLLDQILKTDLILEKSKAENVYSMCIDLFQVF